MDVFCLSLSEDRSREILSSAFFRGGLEDTKSYSSLKLGKACPRDVVQRACYSSF